MYNNHQSVSVQPHHKSSSTLVKCFKVLLCDEDGFLTFYLFFAYLFVLFCMNPIDVKTLYFNSHSISRVGTPLPTVHFHFSLPTSFLIEHSPVSFHLEFKLPAPSKRVVTSCNLASIDLAAFWPMSLKLDCDSLDNLVNLCRLGLAVALY